MNTGEFKRAKLYVKVYNHIKDMICKGIYPEGGKLPSEPELARLLNVSRVTLRQSLALLQEDGVIEARHGSGNIVLRSGNEDDMLLDRLGSPLNKCLAGGYTHRDVESETFPGDLFSCEVFERDVPVFIGVIRTFYQDKTCVAFCYTSLPPDLAGLNSTVNDPEKLADFIENQCYRFAHASHLEFKITAQTDSLRLTGAVSPDKKYMLITEKVMNVMGDVLLFSKYYIPAHKMVLKINLNHKP
ncbi:TPA: GntR family transcriptional regulator [Klebsiella oxytoca]|uniref:GntR family transcriptional regulator n=1 Tax=Klebsiella oxytoca TaxID=571 RepID=A0AAN5LC38_KLEOX|nr:GntR family transcriptional regulator [Klebsiella oxytoca]